MSILYILVAINNSHVISNNKRWNTMTVRNTYPVHNFRLAFEEMNYLENRRVIISNMWYFTGVLNFSGSSEYVYSRNTR